MTFAQPFQEYEILDRVGAGAMGTVFKARHKKLNRIVALKVLKPSLARDGRYVDRLRREARIVASLNHPHIVTGYDLGEEGGYHYFVMEFVEGKSLRALLLEWGMFAEEYVRRVARQVALALDHAYQRGVIHRDIKPGNILIDEQGAVKLTDMGLAKGPADMTITRDGATVGTPQYISPEQARNPQDVDVRTDLYSLGATLYHMATGVPPFRGDTMAELITKLLHETPVPPDELNPALSSGLALVIRKLLAKDLRVRYQTPRELLDDLDRIERAQAPQVDVDELVAASGPRSSWATRLAGLLAILGVVALALWVGMQMRDETPDAPTADEFLVQLDKDLGDQPSPGRRLQRLRAAAETPPPGIEAQLMQRERIVVGELQQVVDAAIGELAGPRWSELQTWLRDASIWPDRQRCERERIAPLLRERAGVVFGQLPPQIRTLRIDELLGAVDRELAQRDRELVARFEIFLASTLPARVEERLRASDFAMAERLWTNSLVMFCDGVRLPLPEKLAPAIATRLGEMRLRAARDATTTIDAAENAVLAAMRAEVDAVTEAQLERLGAGEDPTVVALGVTRLRQDLAQVWPAQARFRVGRDPWPGIEQQIAVVQQAVAASTAQLAEERFERRCDLVWRTYCGGDAEDALAVLEHAGPPSPRHEQMQAGHRTVLEATRAVELALVQALSRAASPVVAFPRNGIAPAVQLQAESVGGTLRLVCRVGAQASRPARVNEFRFRDLVAQLRLQMVEPLQGLPPRQAALGSATVTMTADDLAGIGALLRGLEPDDDSFLIDQVWPRIQRVRGEQPESLLDRQSLFAGLQRARDQASRSGELTELEAAILACETRLPAGDLTDGERTALRTARRWLVLERKRRIVQAEIATVSPRGAAVNVDIVDDGLTAEVAVAAVALHRDAAEGWHLREGVLEFSGGDRPWSETPLQVLRCNPGMDPVAHRATLLVDFVLPPSTVGRRFYVLEFRGIAVVLVVTAGDGVLAALVDGDVRREDAVQRAFTRALLGGLITPRAVVVPGAVHRLTIDLVSTSTRRRAAVKVSFEGTVLLEEPHDLDPDAPLALSFHAQQEVAVHRVLVRAVGL